MIENIRTAANSVVVKVIFGLIVLSFIFASMGGIFRLGSQDNKQYIAKVDGKGLSRTAYENAVRAEIQKNNIKENQLLQIKALREYVLNQQIKNQLLDNFADNIGLSTFSEQIKEYIRNQAIFFENGKFNNERYLRLLAENGLTPNGYAESLRSVMKQQQLFQMLLYSDFVLPVETQIDRLVGQKRTIEMASVSSQDFNIKNRTFTDDELRSYYVSHPEQFTTNNDLIKLEFLRLSPSDMKKNIFISEKQLQNYFDKNKTHYKEPGKMAYSVIETDDKNGADAIYARLLKGENFARLASEHTLYSSQRKDKGFLGWFDEPAVPAMLKTANLSNVGDFSHPLKQDDGHYVIIRLDGKREAFVSPIKMIAERVKADIMRDLIDGQLQKAELTMQNLVNQGLTLDSIAEKMSLKKQSSDWITSQEKPISYSAVAELVMPELGTSNNHQILGPVYVDEVADLYLVRVAGYRAAGLLAFDEVKKDIAVLLQKEDRQYKFEQAANKLVKELNTSSGNAKEKVNFAKATTISRDDKQLDSRVVDTVFSHVPPIGKNPVYGIAYLDNGRGIITSLLHVVNSKADADINKRIFSQWIYGTEYSLTRMLFSKADIKLLTDKEM